MKLFMTIVFFFNLLKLALEKTNNKQSRQKISITL